jgi:hypothetical protein
MKRIYKNGWHEFYGTQVDQCVMCDKPSEVGWGDACTVITDDEEYVIRIGINVCGGCYVAIQRSKINRLIKQKRLEIVKNGEHLHAIP